MAFGHSEEDVPATPLAAVKRYITHNELTTLFGTISYRKLLSSNSPLCHFQMHLGLVISLDLV